MHKLFICLANSRKYTQRCIAGIELKRSATPGLRYEIPRRMGQPVWIRPVSRSDHGQVRSELVDHIKLLDVVRLTGAAAQPRTFQIENMLFDGRRLHVVEHIEPQPATLNKLVLADQRLLFGDTKPAVSVKAATRLDYSLALIKPTTVRPYQTKTSSGLPQVRAEFEYESTTYDFPITDISFSAWFRVEPDRLDNCQHIYLTISLGEVYEGRHYKLIAGVVYF